MPKLLIALLLGILAGAIDVLPIVRTKIPWTSRLFMFVQWVLIGLVVPYLDWELASWLKGLVVGLLGMVPVMILTYGRNNKRIPTIALFGVLHGTQTMVRLRGSYGRS